MIVEPITQENYPNIQGKIMTLAWQLNNNQQPSKDSMNQAISQIAAMMGYNEDLFRSLLAKHRNLAASKNRGIRHRHKETKHTQQQPLLIEQAFDNLILEVKPIPEPEIHNPITTLRTKIEIMLKAHGIDIHKPGEYMLRLPSDKMRTKVQGHLYHIIRKAGMDVATKKINEGTQTWLAVWITKRTNKK